MPCIIYLPTFIAASIISNYPQIFLLIYVDYYTEFWHVNGIAVQRCPGCAKKIAKNEHQICEKNQYVKRIFVEN